MRSRKFILILALAVVITISGILYYRHSCLPPEPTYKGKRVSAWLDDFATPKYSPGKRITSTSRSPRRLEEARKALKDIGPLAVPFICRKLGQNDSPWRNRYRDLWPKLPPWLQKHLTAPKYIQFDCTDAINAFWSIGTNAAPLVLARLHDSNPSVREAALGYFVNNPGDLIPTNQAVAICQRALSDGDPMVRLEAARLLGNLGPAGSNAIPELIAALKTSEVGRHRNHREHVFVHAYAVDALGSMGAVASNAVPALTNLLVTSKTEQYTLMDTAAALWNITSNEDLILPTLLDGLQTPSLSRDQDDRRKEKAIELLAELGPRAKTAFSALVKTLQNSDSDYRFSITNALLKIDPDAAAKVISGNPQQR